MFSLTSCSDFATFALAIGELSAGFIGQLEVFGPRAGGRLSRGF